MRLKKLKKTLFYGGLEKSQYNDIVYDLEEMNNKILVIASALACILIGAMFILSFKVNEFNTANKLYGISAIVSVIILLLSIFTVKQNRWMTHVLTLSCTEIYLVYGIFVSGVIHTEYPAVTYVVIMIFMSLLFVDRPANTNTLTLINSIIFCAITINNKSYSSAIIDIVNIAIFWWLAFTWSCISVSNRIKGTFTDRQLISMAQVDKLTGLKNRNCFEIKRDEYINLFNKNLYCVYIDINGLHQLNNEKGHDAGDEMLIYIAERVKRYFGYEDTYRIGGDEYVIFAIDIENKDIEDSLNKMINDIESAGYSIACGYECITSKRSVKALIKKAESKMFEEKTKYYRTHKR